MDDDEEVSGIAGLAAKVKNIDGKSTCSILKNKNMASMHENPVSFESSKKESSIPNADVPIKPVAMDSKGVADSSVSPKVPIFNSSASSGGVSYAETLKTIGHPKKLNFHFIEGDSSQPGVDVVLPKDSVRSVQSKLEFTLYGYFLGDRIAYPVVDYYVKTNWKKYGLQKSMMNSNGFFFFKFYSEKGMLDVLEGGLWLIRSKPIFLNIWSASSKLKKEDIKSLAVWVKLHDVPLAA